MITRERNILHRRLMGVALAAALAFEPPPGPTETQFKSSGLNMPLQPVVPSTRAAISG